MTEQDKKKFKTVPAMDMDEYKQKIREHRLKILKKNTGDGADHFRDHCRLISLSGFAPLLKILM